MVSGPNQPTNQTHDMTVQSFLALLGEPLNAATLDDDTFAVLVRRPPPKDLGFISRSSTSVSVSVNGHEFAINQSPQLLNSHRPGGTTGAGRYSRAHNNNNHPNLTLHFQQFSACSTCICIWLLMIIPCQLACDFYKHIFPAD